VQHLGYPAQQGGVVFVACTKAALGIMRLKQRFQVIEHKQAAPQLEALQQHVHALREAAWKGRQGLRRKSLQAVGKQVRAWRGITQGTKDDVLESGGHLAHEGDRKRRFADTAHTQHAYHLAVLLVYPLLQLQKFGLSAIKIMHIEGIPQSTGDEEDARSGFALDSAPWAAFRLSTTNPVRAEGVPCCPAAHQSCCASASSLPGRKAWRCRQRVSKRSRCSLVGACRPCSHC
jgi:hypothetical protein